MQYSLALIAGAAMVAAQVPSSIPACGQTCITNMIAIASSEFGCAQGNSTCYCSDPRFGYGLRDCALQACGNDVYQQVLTYGTSVCSGAGFSTSGAVTAVTASPTGTAAVGAFGSGSSTPYSTAAVVTTITSGSSAVATSTIGSTTLFTPVGGIVGGASSASGSASSAASSISASASSAASSAASGASSAASSAASGASSMVSSASSRASSAAGAASSAASSVAGSATSSGFAAHMTAAPMLGGAALAALLMI